MSSPAVNNLHQKKEKIKFNNKTHQIFLINSAF
jgi:hypothetical protein